MELYEILKNAPDDKTIMDSIVITHSKLQRYDKIFCSISGGSDSDILIDLIEKCENENKKIFKKELYSNIENMKDNILYDDIKNSNEIVDDIFKHLNKNKKLTKDVLILIFAKYNNYIIGTDMGNINKSVENDINKMIEVIDKSYNVSKINFVWKKKLEEKNKNMSVQLQGVSEVIADLAEDIKDSKKEKNVAKKISKVLLKVLEEKMTWQKKKSDIKFENKILIFSFISSDIYNLKVGIARAKKHDSPVSGDTSIQTKLNDGKYLLAISDGMGSGPEARKSSKIAIKMLERMLSSGFKKDVSVKMINATLSDSIEEDMYATLDILILDLYQGNIEFIKNGACPTYIKRNKEVELVNSISLPTGIINDIDLVVYDKDIKDGDIIVMCSDGIIESNTEYLHKDLWLKYFLEELQTDDVQQIADLIISEAIDNDYGKEKDDMTVIVAKVSK